MTRRVALLSGGVGGARLARGFEHLEDVESTVVVNVGDDDTFYGWSVSPDVDTVLYTLAGQEGPHGWGRAGDTSVLMDHLAGLGVDTRFRIGDADAALNLYRTMRLRNGDPLHAVTADLAAMMGVRSTVIPATDDRLRTEVRTDPGHWMSFQEYFVLRGHRDEVAEVRFAGEATARPAPGVLEAIADADAVVIAPSNPPLSVWPILAVGEIATVVRDARRVMAVSPLFGGRALKGPADRVLASLGFPPGNAGVAAAYPGLIQDLFIDSADQADVPALSGSGLSVHAGSTRIAEVEQATGLARRMMTLLGAAS
ncbi:2-phospho-L-lactate transferase CofD family protein [Candidatus Spongiisocius sp.]|uniref:2-phospho-L-lactate transferase CofD family protein n=1 Tax=Candidatus Spongiisocius sp. TaxID=3101273 RepID=UPI003B5AB4A5